MTMIPQSTTGSDSQSKSLLEKDVSRQTDLGSPLNPIPPSVGAPSAKNYGRPSTTGPKVSTTELISRHKEIFNPETNPLSVTIVGCGTIGSNVAVLLARLGIRDITIIDDDIVSESNLSHQDYAISDLGKPKVLALAERLMSLTGVEAKVSAFRTDGKELKTDILVLAVDSMSARKDIVTNASYKFCVDGRTGGELLYVYAFSGLERDKYWKYWAEDDKVPELPCGGKSINYVSYIVSALMEICIKKYATQEQFPFEQIFDIKQLRYVKSKL